MRSLFSVFFSLFLCAVVYELPAQVRFQATTDARQVFVKNYLEVTFTLQNAEGVNFRPPTFGGARVVNGPARSMRSTIINGVSSSEASYSYTLQPQTKGTLRIGSATIVANGITLKSNPIEVEVLEADAEPTDGTEPIFARAIPDVIKAYPGQQILLDYKIFTSVNVETYNLIEEPYYADSYAVPLRHFTSRSQREIIQGREYTTGVVRRVALFPQKAGTLKLGPLKLQAGIAKPNPGGRGTFFDRRMEYTFLETPPVEFEILTLPDLAPHSFSGAVGDFTMTSSVSRDKLTTDDALSIRMIVRGDGDIKRVQVPELNLPTDSFDVYQPKVLSENSIEQGGKIHGEKTIEYLVIPKFPGQYIIAPAFSWFEPDSAKFQTAVAGPFKLEVRQGSGARTEPDPVPPVAGTALQPIRTSSKWQKPGKFLLSKPLYWASLLFPFGLLGLAVLLKRQQKQNANVDPALLKKQNATRMAEAHLATAAKHLEADNGRAFYEAVSNAFLGYISDKLEVERAQLSKNNVRQRLEQLQVPESATEDFIQILTACDMAIFGRQENPANMDDHYRKAVQVIASIEESLAYQ